MDSFQPLRPILFALKTPAYKLTKSLVLIICSVSMNQYRPVEKGGDTVTELELFDLLGQYILTVS